jgi:hypothetical protein
MFSHVASGVGRGDVDFLWHGPTLAPARISPTFSLVQKLTAIFSPSSVTNCYNEAELSDTAKLCGSQRRRAAATMLLYLITRRNNFDLIFHKFLELRSVALSSLKLSKNSQVESTP